MSLTVRALVDLYLRHCEVEGVHCEEARVERVRVLGCFVGWPVTPAIAPSAEVVSAVHAGPGKTLGDLLVTDCKPFHLVDFIEAHPGWKSVSTRRAKANMIRAAFAWAAEQERIDRNPFLRVRYAEAERRPDLPDATLARVCYLSNKPFERACRFLRLTGCRVGELAEALWPDMNLEAGVWTIHRHKSRKHTQRPKLVALVPEAVELLREIRREIVAPAATTGVLAVGVPSLGAGNAEQVVFTNNRGTPWNHITLGQHLRRMKRRHGIDTPATLHGIRHRFGSAGVAAGAPIKLVSQQLGHSTVAVTERYYCDLSGEMDAIRAAAVQAQVKK